MARVVDSNVGRRDTLTSALVAAVLVIPAVLCPPVEPWWTIANFPVRPAYFLVILARQYVSPSHAVTQTMIYVAIATAWATWFLLVRGALLAIRRVARHSQAAEV
jgi:hypothetical protein